MRIKNGFKNMIASFFVNILTIIVGLIAQAIFIKILGVEYLGLNGLFTNIISMLGIVELGLGSAIIYNLYKPLKENDKKTIKSLMKFYKKSYHLIAFVVLIIGLIIIPFLPFIINEVTVKVNIIIIYLLFLIEIVCSYLLSYKRSILYADQKNYIISYIHAFYIIIMNLLQLIILYLTNNYYLYLIIKIIMRVIENIVITYIANKKYSYLLDKEVEELDKEIENDIFKKIKALFFHKIGSFVILGTDNIIISKYLGLVTVGLYSNYYLIINAILVLFSQALMALTPSVGSLLVENDKKKSYDVFKKIRFMNFWIAAFASISMLVIMDSFITIWIGKNYLLSKIVLIVLSFNLFQKLMRSSYQAFKEAAGIYFEDRYVPLVESLLNIIVSIIMVKLIGLAGVFVGTIVSGFALWFYSYPKYIYKTLFNRSLRSYLKETLGYIFLFVILGSITYTISINFIISNVYLNFLKNVLISVILPNAFLLIIFYKNDSFKYYLKLIRMVVLKK